jgi:MSHA pilin protein MshC
MRRMVQSGFTMVEVVTVILIAGILATMVGPRFFERGVFESRGYYDQAISALRYAQRAAMAKNRFICVAITTNGITLTYDPTAPSVTYTVASCPGSALASPTGEASYAVNTPNGVSLSGGASFYFDVLGRPTPNAQQSITVSGYTAPITIEAETGYVH